MTCVCLRQTICTGTAFGLLSDRDSRWAVGPNTPAAVETEGVGRGHSLKPGVASDAESAQPTVSIVRYLV